MLKAVIFDVDGTLLDTERIYIRAWKEGGRALGWEIPDSALMATRGMDISMAIGIFKREVGEDFDYHAVRRERVRIAEEIIEREGADVKPGVEELLTDLRRRGIPMAVASSTVLEKTRSHLARSGLDGWFDVMVGGDMVSTSKPNPEIFLKAAELLKMDPADCVVVEDSNSGIEAAWRAGMRSILVPDLAAPSEATLQRATAVLTSLKEAPAALEAMENVR